MTRKPIIHGRDHSPGGSDPLSSSGAASGDVLTADGAGGIQWAAGGGGGGGVDLHHPRFISCENDIALPSGGYHVPFPNNHIITNDLPSVTSGYDKAQGDYITSAPSNWAGDYFMNAAGTSDPFAIKRIGGVYMLFASAYIYSATPITVVFQVTVPNAGGNQGRGIPGFGRDNYVTETVVFDASQDRIWWARTFMFVNSSSSSGETFEPVGLTVTQTTGATLSLGPPSFGLGAVRLNMIGAYPPP